MRRSMYCFFILLLFHCDTGPAFNATDSNNGSSFNIKEGEFFTVSLRAQLSTGYSWNAVLSDDSIILQKGKPETISLEKDEAKTGGFEVQQFTFVGNKTGSTKLIINYSQSWTQKDPIKVYKININIK